MQVILAAIEFQQQLQKSDLKNRRSQTTYVAPVVHATHRAVIISILATSLVPSRGAISRGDALVATPAACTEADSTARTSAVHLLCVVGLELFRGVNGTVESARTMFTV